jgi:glycosyltransferase involved in cell wall biosynthesis
VHGQKNEADILREMFISALHWCDHIYVLDNGSTDGSWELVKELATQYSQIVPFKQDDVLYTNGLRADIFNGFRSDPGPEDWWCALDADEFYIDDPRIFLAKISSRFKTVWTASLNYYITDKDAILYREDPVRFVNTPIQQRLHYYCNNWGELRFFRNHDDIQWTRPEGGFPPAMFHAPAYPVRMWLKHYQYRFPEQIERRLLTRRPSTKTDFLHEITPNWRINIATKRDAPLDFKDADPKYAASRWEERIVPAVSLNYDAFDRRYVVNENLMPQFPIPIPHSRRLKAMFHR